MTYPYGGPDQHPLQSPGAYGGYWPQLAGAAKPRSSPRSHLLWAVLVLGLAAYVLGYSVPAQAAPTGWSVRFSALAAVVAALGLLPRQSAHTTLTAALAVMGFLEALSWRISASHLHNPNWAMIVIVVVNAAQAVTAIIALVAELRVRRAVERAPAPSDMYAYYAQAAQHYYAANPQSVHNEPVQTPATAQAESAAYAQHSAAQRYALYAEYVDAQRTQPNPPAASRQSGERTPTGQPAAAAGIPASGATESIARGNDSAAESTGRSSPW
jgi:hypothetical protein